MAPPSVKGEVYCFPRRRLIFRFAVRVIYHSKGLLEFIPKSISSKCWAVCQSASRSWNEELAFVFILNLRCYTSIDSSRQALQSNGSFFKFKLVFELLAENRKNIAMNREA